MDDANQAQPNQDIVASPQPINIAPKEQEPISSLEGLVKPSETEPSVDKELTDIGVQKTPQAPVLTIEAKEAGMQHAKEAIPVLTQPSGAVQLMQDVKAQGGNTKNSNNSIRWLWELLKKLAKLGH